jgi:ABC-2 type transport system permease protein
MNLVTSAIGTAVGLSDDLGSGVIDRFRTLPMWKPAILVGRSLTDLLTAVLCGTFVVVTGLVIGWRPHSDVGSVIGAFALFLLFSYALSWGCACIGLFSRDAESSQGLGLVILFPLAIISDALVPIQRMALVPRVIAEWNPVSAVTSASRRLLGNPDPAATIHAWPLQHPALAAVLWSLVMLAVFAPLAARLYRTRTAD